MERRMCQFTPQDSVVRHRVGTRCRYTGQVAGSDGCSTVIPFLALAIVLAGSAKYLM